jgi:gas vesicle protein
MEFFRASVFLEEFYLFCGSASHRCPTKTKEKNMHTKEHTDEYEYTEETSNTKSVLAGLVIGGLVGAGAALLFAPQPGEKTRTELQHGALELRDRTSETVKETITQAKSKANQIKQDVQIKAGEIQHQGKGIIAKQLDRVEKAAVAGKRAIEES